MSRIERRFRRGFTLIELIVVITIIGILAAAVVINAPAFVKRARIKRALADIKSIETAVTSYRMEYARWPESLQDLVTPPDTGYGQEEPLLTKIPRDPWNNEFYYAVQDGKPVIISFGEDQQEGTPDDITNIDEEEGAGAEY